MYHLRVLRTHRTSGEFHSLKKNGQEQEFGLRHHYTASINGYPRDYFFIPRTASFAALATRNLTTVLAGILIFCGPSILKDYLRRHIVKCARV